MIEVRLQVRQGRNWFTDLYILRKVEAVTEEYCRGMTVALFKRSHGPGEWIGTGQVQGLSEEAQAESEARGLEVEENILKELVTFGTESLEGRVARELACDFCTWNLYIGCAKAC